MGTIQTHHKYLFYIVSTPLYLGSMKKIDNIGRTKKHAETLQMNKMIIGLLIE